MLRKTVLGVLVTAGVVLTAAAQGVDIPASGTPGGARPILDPIPEERIQIPDFLAEQPKLKKPTATAEATRLPITKIRLLGFIPHPAQGITQHKVDQIIEHMRKAFLKQHHRKPNGWAKGLTLGDVQNIANALTRLYRQSGFILSRVYVPSQDITHEKTVTLKVLEGRLGRTIVDGNKRYKSSNIQDIFKSQIGKPIYVGDIEHGLLSMNALPGLKAYSVFRPGQKTGNSEVVLKVTEEKHSELVFGGDNHGTNLSGRLHGTGGLTWFNPTGGGDKLVFIGVQNADPSNGTNLTASYQHPIFSNDNIVGASFSEGVFDLGGSLASSNISGKLTSGNTYWQHYFKRRRTRQIVGRLDFKRQQAVTIQAGAELNKDNRAALSVGGTLYQQFPVSRSSHALIVELIHGFDGFLGASSGGNTSSGRQGASGEYARGLFNSATGDYHYQRCVGDFNIVRVHTKGQYSKDLLSSSYRFGLGGPTTVRAYPSNEYLFESGVLGQVEWLSKTPFISDMPVPFLKYRWGDIFHLVAFADYGTGWVVDPTASDDSQIILAGYGVGLRMNVPGKLTVKLEASKPFKWAKPNSDGQDVRYWFSFYYTPKFG